MEETDEALNFAANKSESCPTFMPNLIGYRSRTGQPFLKILFERATLTHATAIEWWMSRQNQLEPDVLQIVQQLLTATSSTAGLERLFSKIALVHSDLRNRLGTDKAGKLVFVMGKYCQN